MHVCVCVPVPLWHLGQLIEAPNFFTIATVMWIRRPLAVIGVFAMSAQPSSGCGGSAASSSAASGGEVQQTGLMSQGHPATPGITSRLHLLLSGSRRTALNRLAPRWSRPMCSSLPSAFPAHTTSTQCWSSFPSFFVVEILAQTISPNSTVAPPYLSCLMSSEAVWHDARTHNLVMSHAECFATDPRFEPR